MFIRLVVLLSLAGAVWAQTRDTASIFGASNPVTGLTNSNFGRLTSAGSPRIVQFALKILF